MLGVPAGVVAVAVGVLVAVDVTVGVLVSVGVLVAPTVGVLAIFIRPISHIVVEIRFDGSTMVSLKPRSGPLGFISLSTKSFVPTSLGLMLAPAGKMTRIR